MTERAKVKVDADRTALAEVDRLRYALEDEREYSTELWDMLVVILPMAKGYAAEHRVGRNDEYVAEAEALIFKGFPENRDQLPMGHPHLIGIER